MSITSTTSDMRAQATKAIQNVSVTAYDEKAWHSLREQLTVERVNARVCA